MNVLEVIVTASAGLNVFILAMVMLNTYRIGKVKGGLENGWYVKCPFYKKRVQNVTGTKGSCKE